MTRVSTGLCSSEHDSQTKGCSSIQVVTNHSQRRKVLRWMVKTEAQCGGKLLFPKTVDKFPGKDISVPRAVQQWSPGGELMVVFASTASVLQPHRGGTHGAPGSISSASVSVDVSGSPFSPALAPTSPRNATIPVQTALSPDVKTEIALAVERLQFATLLGERKKAVSALQSLAQKFDASRSPGGRKSSGVDPTVEEQELGNTAVPAVLAALVSDPRDTELMEALLELLQSIVSRAPSAALLLLEQPPESSVTTPGACKPSLQEAQPGAFAKSVLECKEGLRRLLEVVEDRREHIRDAALAVLGQLTGRDKNAQQFLAFEEGFARLFQIMEVEGLTETGASPASSVIADCLQIVNNMVRDNSMTQTLFLEMSYLESHVPRILRLSGIDGGDEEEDAAALGRRKRVLKLGLQLVRFLLAELYEGAKESSLDEMAKRDRARKTLDLLRLVSEHNGGAQMILVNLYASPSGRNVLAELVNLDVGNESDESPVAAAASALLDALFQENEGARMAFLCEDEEEKALKIANTTVTAPADEDPGLQMTRDQLLQLISKRTQSSRALLAYRATYDISDANEAGEDDEAHYLFMLYERAFTIFYREMAEQIQKRSMADLHVLLATPALRTQWEPIRIFIRMQDKQIHDLQRQVEELKHCTVSSGANTNETSSTDQRREQQLMEQLAAQREQFEREKADLEAKTKTMSEAVLEMETRVNGLTMAYEQLEREHQQRGHELAAARSVIDEDQSSLPSSNVNEELTALQAELDAERDTNRRLRSEAAVRKGSVTSQALREKSDAELANARLMKQLEELRVDSERKDEQLAESNQMLETLTEGQALVKTDNERLKAQLAEALSKCGEAPEAEFKSVVDGVMEDKLRLERRVEELEAAARAAYEKDQQVLQQRIQEVEQARRASPPASDEPENALPSTRKEPQEVNVEDPRLNELVSSQLEELKELRALVVEMESVAKEREAKIQQDSFLQELVAGYDVQSRRDKEKYNATIRELEDELARAFLEKKEAGRKAKAAVKELENEVARLFLAKVELEKELALQHGEEANQAVNGEVSSAHGSFRRSVASDNSNDSTVDDLLVLVASLEIQCSVLRETLKETQEKTPSQWQ
ncbi:hypothetical protein GQ600_22304 [Phytophthora cactorum]|nr:hypothetical protein GQ600_22304 [Phytophthora cactorum]